ncbi:hypothetical protein [Sphingomonas aracearum]|uniref:Uncharacterized protein n=1 Tax=Sphingomonas aracearum TaxID=2283317 RepID=A0A369VQC1_9SPHN|nr:hypothetical protein [Sphingomonas aracearum]RDE04203.1 hypothetical protein DVW87_17465 [Sphingomonas aracearum]
MTLDLSDFNPKPLPSREYPPYASADPATDLRLLFAGTKWSDPGHGGDPTKTEAGDWMIRVMLDLPYPMLASLEAKAGSHNVGELIRAALVTAGHGTGSDIVGVRSDRYATRNEQRERRGISAEISGTREGE